MSDFSQPSSLVTTLHILRENPEHMRALLRENAAQNKTVLVVPCLASEFNNETNLPVFENILRELAKVDYLAHVIFGLDKADAEDEKLLWSKIELHGLKNAVVHWNQGPVWSAFYDRLCLEGIDLSTPGKGRNVFMSYGIALALGARVVACIDADIKTFRRDQLDRLVFPQVVLDYDFSKAYYARLHQGRLYGRVKRLLLDPLLLAMKRKFSYTREEKFSRIIDYLLTFRYQLSGEVAFRAGLLRKMRFAMNWGTEIYTLMEAYRKTAAICQVEFSPESFDHKHQESIPSEKSGALHRMSVEIIATLMNSFVVEEGLELSPTFFRDLAITYQSVAEQMIKKYSHESLFSGLSYDRPGEERAVRDLFRPALIATGQQLASRKRLGEIFLSFVNTNQEFGPYLADGLAETITKVAEQGEKSIFELDRPPSWERVAACLPNIMPGLAKAALAGRPE